MTTRNNLVTSIMWPR